MGLQLCKFPAEVKGKQPSGVTDESAVTRIRTEVAAATTQSTNHYTITARHGSCRRRSPCSYKADVNSFPSLRCCWTTTGIHRLSFVSALLSSPFLSILIHGDGDSKIHLTIFLAVSFVISAEWSVLSWRFT